MARAEQGLLSIEDLWPSHQPGLFMTLDEYSYSFRREMGGVPDRGITDMQEYLKNLLGCRNAGKMALRHALEVARRQRFIPDTLDVDSKDGLRAAVNAMQTEAAALEVLAKRFRLEC